MGVASREETSSRGGGAPSLTSQPHCRFPATFAGRREVARGQAAVGVLRCGGAPHLPPSWNLPPENRSSGDEVLEVSGTWRVEGGARAPPFTPSRRYGCLQPM